MSGLQHKGSLDTARGTAVRRTVRLEGAYSRTLDVARNRLVVAGIFFLLAFLVIGGRLVTLAAIGGGTERAAAGGSAWVAGRGDIFDRNGVLLATSLPTPSLYADPSEVLDPIETARRLMQVFPDLDRTVLLNRLSRDCRFVWIRRNITPEEQHAVNWLGLPGLGFRIEARRVYPHGSMVSHLVGFTNRAARGVAGAESAFDAELAADLPVTLSVDVGVQSILHQELMRTIKTFRAVGAAGVVLDAENGEVLAMVSLPDFDPNDPASGDEELRFNRATQGVYEMGSTFKLFTAAMALDSGTVTLESGYDASRPIRISRHTIRDFHPENRWLSVPEILVHSSNIGAAQMALDVGAGLQRKYLQQLGLLTAPGIELPEVGKPLQPGQWRDVNTMTIGFGHGIAVSPLQVASSVATVVNGGVQHRPTIVRREAPRPLGEQVLSARTSERMRAMMRLAVMRGTGTKADVPGLRVGGKTGTAEKLIGGRYNRSAKLVSFVGAFPIDHPRYVVVAVVDEPKGTRETYGYATGGWVAAPAVGRIADRIAPILGVEPVMADIEEIKARERGEHRIIPAVLRGDAPMTAFLRQAMAQARGRPGAAH